MTERTRLEDWIDYFFRPPFSGLPILAWLYFVLSFLAVSASGILHGNLPDTDDYLYVVKAIDLIHGQGWFDPIQHRMNPPEGTYIHFSNILSAFYAVPIKLLTPLFGEIGAATVMAALMPLFYLAMFFKMLRHVAESFVGAEWARVTSFIALFAVTTMFQFAPGHIDHHGLEIILLMTALWASVRMLTEPDSFKWPLLGGFILALALAIALEVLPVLIIIVGWVGFWAAVKGERAAYAGLVFGAVLVVSATLLLLVERGSAHMLDIDLLAYSVVYVIMLAGTLLCFAGVAIAARWNLVLRGAIGFALACGSAAAFLHYFPMLKTGPYGAMDPALAKLMFENVSEAVPVVRPSVAIITLVTYLIWPVMAAVTAFGFLCKESRSNEKGLWTWGLLSALIVVPTLLASFYQARFLPAAEAFSVLALVVLLRRGLDVANRKYSGGTLCAARTGMILGIGLIPSVLFPALVDGRSFNPGVVLYINQSAQGNPCDLNIVSDMLAMPSYYGDRPRVIMDMIDHGPELMFRTPHKVLAAPYHLNVSGNLDSVHFFSARSADEAHEIARQRGADLVLMCKTFADLYSVRDIKDKAIMNEAGKIESNDKSFAHQLVDGKVPDWLKPIEYPLFGNMMLFEVRDPKTKDKGVFIPGHPNGVLSAPAK